MNVSELLAFKSLQQLSEARWCPEVEVSLRYLFFRSNSLAAEQMAITETAIPQMAKARAAEPPFGLRYIMSIATMKIVPQIKM